MYIGWRRGVVREAAALVGVLIGIWTAVHFSRLIALVLGLTGENAIIIVFFIIFVGTMILASLLGRTADRVIRAVKMNLVNKIAGTAFGLVKALCISSVVLSGLVLIDTEGDFISEETRERSMLYSPVNNTGNELISSLKEYIEEHPDLTKKIVETDEKTSDKVSEKTKKVEEKKAKKESGKKGGHK